MKYLTLPLLILLQFTSINAQSSKNNQVSITGHPDYPPVIWHNKKEDKLKGIAVEALTKMLKEINIDIYNRPIATWGRALKEVSDGNVDILLPPYKTEPRLKQYLYPKKPFLMDETVIFLRKGQKLDLTSLADLRKYKGVAIINDSFGDVFDELDRTQLKMKRLTKTEQCFRFLLKGRADYVIAGKNAGISVMGQMGVSEDLEIHKLKVIQTGMYFGLSLKSKKQIGKIRDHLEKRTEELKKQGYFKELEEKYFKMYLREMKVNK
jgi:polar amino acid transport system substrate-binding protein